MPPGVEPAPLTLKGSRAARSVFVASVSRSASLHPRRGVARRATPVTASARRSSNPACASAFAAASVSKAPSFTARSAGVQRRRPSGRENGGGVFRADAGAGNRPDGRMRVLRCSCGDCSPPQRRRQARVLVNAYEMPGGPQGTARRAASRLLRCARSLRVGDSSFLAILKAPTYPS